MFFFHNKKISKSPGKQTKNHGGMSAYLSIEKQNKTNKQTNKKNALLGMVEERRGGIEEWKGIISI